MFYTYIHRRLDTGEIFYVGKGSGSRAHSTSSRGRHWMSIYRKHGRHVELCAEWATEEEAHAHEILLIETLRSIGCPLVNRTAGGEGVSGLRHKPESIEAMRRGHLAWWADPKNRASCVEKMRDRWSDPELRSILVSRLRARFSSADVDSRRRNGILAANERPDVRARRSEAQKAAQQKSEARQKQRMARLRSATPGGRPARPVVCMNTGDRFDSAADAGRYFGLPAQNVASTCRGERAGVGGLVFIYATSGSPVH